VLPDPKFRDVTVTKFVNIEDTSANEDFEI
jgi:hypothetical protein